MTTASREKKGRGVLREEFGNPERRTAYYMILPAVLIILLVACYPVVYSLYLSFFQANINNVGAFVGLENYVEMFRNSEFQEGLVNTVVFTVVSVTFEFAIELDIALAINRAFRGRGLVRAAVLVPWAFPTVISAVMWRLMFQDQVGVINRVANAAGVITEPILSDRTLLLIGAIVVDGANAMRRFFRITLPLLKPAILVTVLFRALDAHRIYGLFWAMSNRELESLSTFVYKGVRVSQLKSSFVYQPTNRQAFSEGNAFAQLWKFFDCLAFAPAPGDRDLLPPGHLVQQPGQVRLCLVRTDGLHPILRWSNSSLAVTVPVANAKDLCRLSTGAKGRGQRW